MYSQFPPKTSLIYQSLFVKAHWNCLMDLLEWISWSYVSRNYFIQKTSCVMKSLQSFWEPCWILKFNFILMSKQICLICPPPVWSFFGMIYLELMNCFLFSYFVVVFFFFLPGQRPQFVVTTFRFSFLYPLQLG